jgi:L-serine dehydratase
MRTSVFDLFRVGIGPSSSHTCGPMRAARAFVVSLDRDGHLGSVRRVEVDLYGSLALTGRGHLTDAAVLLGLSGEDPEQVDPERIRPMVESVRRDGTLTLLGRQPVRFTESSDLRWHADETLPRHPNALRLTASGAAGETLDVQTYYSIGGGFILREGESETPVSDALLVPYPFDSGTELLARGRESGLRVWQLMLANERVAREEEEIRTRIAHLWDVMRESIDRGLNTSGSLPGGLNVIRRAPQMQARVATQSWSDPLGFVDRLNMFAIAVNEENAAGGRIVTAPTNGAAGIVPAVARYYRDYVPYANDEGLLRYFLTAGAIGILYKEHASISGAEVGCQGEVGVACSMAAAGLAGALGATNEQIEHAAEIGMEHHLGMTCDPVAGLVQIPCIERNAFGAVKAVNACRLAMQDHGEHKISLDQVIRTMYQTGLDMQRRYKETSLGGLAVNAVNC